MLISSNHISSGARRLAIRLPRPLWIGIAATIMVVAALLLLALQFHFRGLAIREIVDAGGSVEMRPSGPDWLRERLGEERMTSFDEVIHVKLSYSRANDETLGRLPRLLSVRRLDLNGTRVTDAGLAHLRGLTKLEWLWLSDTEVTDAGLAHLSGMTRLNELGLGGTRITDAGLIHLKGMTDLRELWLNGTQVTDAGLIHLKALSRLELLVLRGASVTDEGVGELKRTLPSLNVQR